MDKIFILVICLISSFCESVTSTNIECSFVGGNYYVVGDIYRCSVNNNPNILTEESAKISGISGTHKSSKNNDDVLGIYAEYKTMQVFPTGLDKFFKNIKLIYIRSCKLKEIHQADLKVFPKLVYFLLYSNEIEVIEEGLFDYNPNLELIGFYYETKIVHIDPNVFDNLNKLRYFWFPSVPCVNQNVLDSKEQVQAAIKIVKSNCENSEFLSLDSQIKNLEIESKTLNSESFNTKLESFENDFKISKFSKFRPLNYKFEILKNERCSNCRQLSKIESLDARLIVLNKNIADGQKKVDDSFKDLILSQCGLKNPLVDIKSTQNSLQNTLSTLKSSVEDQGPKLDQIQKTQSQFIDELNEVTSSQGTMKITLSQLEAKVSDLKSSQASSINSLGAKMNDLDTTQKNHGAVLSDIQNSHKKASASIDVLSMCQNDTTLAIEDLKQSQNYLKNSLESVKSSQDSSLSNITSKFSKLEKDIKSIHDDTKLSVSDIVATLSDHTKFQAEAKDSFVKIRTVQNEIKKSLNDLSMSRNDNSDVSSLNNKDGSLEGHFVDFEARNEEKLGKIEKELTNKFHKMSINFDEKVKGIEKRLMKKFEEILEEKLGKIFDEKLGNLIDAKLGTN